jgi:hypothetical protein
LPPADAHPLTGATIRERIDLGRKRSGIEPDSATGENQ